MLNVKIFKEMNNYWIILGKGILQRRPKFYLFLKCNLPQMNTFFKDNKCNLC